MSLNRIGYNSKGNFDPQANLLLLFSQTQHEPMYYRLLPGNIRDVTSVKISRQEAGIRDAACIADKCFYSENNITELKCAGLKYVIPLKRNHRMIDYGPFQQGGKQAIDHYFKFQKRYIFCHLKQMRNGIFLYIFLDDKLKCEEQSYLDRIDSQHEEKLSITDFHNKAHAFGTFSILTNIVGKEPREIYKLYKSRGEVEVAFDAFKNTLEANRTYMRNDQTVEGWMFMNYLALLIYWRILKLLMKTKLLSKFSIQDVSIHLSHIQKIRINGEWYVGEITNKTRKLCSKLGYDIT